MMKTYGLTGGIASGKSVVAKVFQSLGAKVVDADAIARDCLNPEEEAYAKVIDIFGEFILLPDGSIDRKALRSLVFNDDEKRAELNGIVHPIVFEKTAIALSEASRAGYEVAIYEAALLVETGAWKNFDGLIVVWCDEAVQLERLMQRDEMTEEKAQAMINSQLPTHQKRALAGFEIDTNETLAKTKRQAEEIWRLL